jgi:uncharacterized membrane protein YhhN
MLPVLVCVLAVVGLLVAERADSAVGRAVAKLVAASAFVWAGVAWGGLETAYGQWLLAGLVLCWLGDALLLPAGQSIWFQLGIAAFLLGHVAYAMSFARLGVDPVALVGFGVVLAMPAALALRWLRPHVPTAFRVAVFAYVAVISAMVAVALSSVVGGAPLAIGVGAVGFALSDVSVARDRFVAPGFVNGAWGLPAYFASQLVLAYSISLV